MYGVDSGLEFDLCGSVLGLIIRREGGKDGGDNPETRNRKLAGVLPLPSILFSDGSALWRMVRTALR